ncbi:MAG: beta-ketoacyl synthase chain length factor [Bacteroidetes bacterium]|nr:beta-ketoacyl synthase chain length factor [Bacteroidota bacterium]
MAFINGIGLISPQKTAETTDFLQEVMEYDADYLKCIEPASYKPYIDPIQSRRMSRLIKMGIASAKMCLNEAGCTMPDAIITGTGLGSVEDTEKILGTIHLDQPFLNPTPFMQSTYNTISSQIAIQLKCHNYNSTYVHRTFSFESSIQDALLQIAEGTGRNILAGGIDEMTLNHLNITRRPGHWKMSPVKNLEMLTWDSPGALAGEGASYFLLSAERSETTYAQLLSVKTIYKPANPGIIERHLQDLVTASGLDIKDISLVILGINGDNRNDGFYRDFSSSLFPDTPVAFYKQLCGEYHTSTGFALWLAANILKRQSVPSVIRLDQIPCDLPHNVLIYNQYYNVNHSLMLVTRDAKRDIRHKS